ncbi:hypothetical protein MTO96_042701 [Rhipicephalus appendiculatus]
MVKEACVMKQQDEGFFPYMVLSLKGPREQLIRSRGTQLVIRTDDREEGSWTATDDPASAGNNTKENCLSDN